MKSTTDPESPWCQMVKVPSSTNSNTTTVRMVSKGRGAYLHLEGNGVILHVSGKATLLAVANMIQAAFK